MPIDFRSINRHRGDFTKKARSAGMGVQEYAKHVLANTGNYDTRTVRQASFAKAATKFKHHALGGSLNIYAGDEPERKYNNTTLILNAMRDNDYSSGYGSLADMELRDSLVANPNFILENDKNGKSLRNTAERIASYDGPSYAQTLKRSGLLQQDKMNFMNFDADRAERVRARMLEKGYNEKQIAAVINGLHDETPNYEYRMGWWYRDDDGKLRKSRTERDDWIAWDVGPFQFTDNKLGAQEGTKYLRWCEENGRDPYDLDDGLEYFLDVYLPDRLDMNGGYAEIWNNPDADVSEIGSGFMKYVLASNKRKNDEWLEKKGRMARQIYEHRPGVDGEVEQRNIIPSPLTPYHIDNGGYEPVPLQTEAWGQKTYDPNFIYGTYPPRDIKTDQSAAEPVRTDMSGNQGVFAAGGDKWEPEQEDKPITELYPIKKSYGFFTGSGMHQLPKYVRREIRERAKRIRNNPHSGRFWDGRYVSPYDPLSHYTPDDYTLVKDWEEYVREKNIPDISKIVPKDPRPLGELDLPYNLPTDGNFGLPVYSAGGELAHSHGAWWPNGLQFVNAGGTHEQNPNMGVQVGVDGEGTPNLVEEGEVIYDDYVFSNRLYPTKKELEEANLPVSYAKKTFAYIAERMGKESEERPNDAVSRRGLEAMLQRLATIQERQRQERGLVGTQQMEQGAGMPQMPQGTSPQDMLAMQQAGGGQVPPEMLAQMAGGAAYGQSEGYAPEGDGEAPEVYAGEGYLSAYGGPLVSVFRHGGHKSSGRNNRRTLHTNAVEATYDDEYPRTAAGTRKVVGGQEDQAVYDNTYRKKRNRVLRHMETKTPNHRTYDEILTSYSNRFDSNNAAGSDGESINGGELDAAVVNAEGLNNKWYSLNERLKFEDGDGNPYPLLEPGTLNGGIMRPQWEVPYEVVESHTKVYGDRDRKRLAKTDAVHDALKWVKGQIDLGADGKAATKPPYIDAYGGNIYALGSPMDLFYSTMPQRQTSFNSMLNEIRAPFYPSEITPGNIPFVKGAPGATGKPEPLPTNMRYASAMGPAVSALVNAFRRPDNSEARAYESVAANVPTVGVRPRMLSNHMPYNPVSREFALNPVRAQTGATRRANVGLNAGQANALNLALNYQTAPLIGQAIAQTDAQNLERMRQAYDFNRQTDMTNAQNDLAAQTTNAQNELNRYNLVASLRSQAAKARSQERADLEEARTQSLAGVFGNLGAIGKENLAYNQAVSSNMYYNPLRNGESVYVGGPDNTVGNGTAGKKAVIACGGMLTRRKTSKRAGR